MKLFRKARFFWVYPIVIWLFLIGDASEKSLRLGTAFVLLGELVRLWANGYVGHRKVNFTQQWRNDPKIGHLITAGPYAHVRHPLYFGTFLIGVGFCVVVRSLPLAAVALAFFLLVYREKAQREERIIAGEWGAAYAAYRQAVPRWLPSLRGYAQPYGQWSWQGVRASKELKTLVWVIVTLLAIYLREEWLQERELFVGRHAAKHAFLFGLALALIASDILVELVSRWRAASKPQAS